MEHKRRGRKREHDEEFFQNAENKIAKVREQLKTAKADGLNVNQRARLRNQISAQTTRVRRRKELLYLNDVVRAKDAKFKALTSVLFEQLNDEDLTTIYLKMTEKWDLYKSAPISKYQKVLLENFVTPQSELDQFIQNEYK